MAFFSDLWDGIKNVGSAVVDVFNIIMGALVKGVFWLVDRVFDAVEAVLDLFEWLFEEVGEIFTSSEKDKNLIILPTTPEVEKIIGTEIEKGNVTVAKEKVKLRANKSKLQAIVADGKVKKMVIAGSEQGFSQEIKEATERGRLYQIPVED